MILYLDTSALVKRYVAEPGTAEVAQAIASAEVAGTSIIARGEMAAALSRAVRGRLLAADVAASALQVFRSDWPRLVRVQATEYLVARADGLAWDLGLRGSDAVHLAAGLLWQEGMDEPVTFATFDRRLWEAAAQRGLQPYPVDLPGLLDAWQR